MRAVPRAGLLRLGLRDRRFGYPLEMVVRAAEAGWRVSERDVPYRPRTGKSKVTGTVGGTLRTVRDMSRVLLAAPPDDPAVLASPSPDDQAVPAGPPADDQVTVPAPPAVPPPANGTAR
jgi:dTDP-L-rhamnose 4-epimerase